MKSKATNANEVDPAPDVLVPRPMDRVLQSERAAQAAVAECERACAEALEHYRQQAGAILSARERRSLRCTHELQVDWRCRWLKIIEKRKNPRRRRLVSCRILGVAKLHSSAWPLALRQREW